MERLIWVTWRGFWIGLGASAVLIVQAVAVPAGATSPEREMSVACRTPEPPLPRIETTKANGTQKSAAPILSRNPFDSKTGPLAKERVKHPRGV